MLRRALWTRGSRLLQHQPSAARSFHRSPAAMARILCSDPIDAVCPELLRAAGHDVTAATTALSHAELVAQVPDYDVLIVRSGSKVDRQVLDAAEKLQLIGRAGTGVDNIDMVNATKQGVLVMNTPFGNTISAAELTVGLISAVSRLGHATAKPAVRNSEIHGKTIGIVGLGRIGREVATRCNAFGMNVIGYDPILSNASAKTHGVEPVSLDELFSRSDYISLHVPLNANTKHLVNAQRLALCKDGVKLINGARAGLIDHPALLESIESGKVAGMAFDINAPSPVSDTWKKLVSHENVIVTPHIGALTTDAQQKVARDLAYKINDALAGKSFKGVLNAPNIDFGKREEFMPLLSLAEKLGSMQAQLLDDSRLKRVLVIAEGPKVTSSELSGQLVKGVLKGLLSHMLEEEVTFTNAKQLADVMGIQTVEHKHDEVSGSSFSDQLTVIFEKENGTSKKITGTVFGKSQLRLVSFDDVPMDAIPSGSMLLFNNTDQPGVLHKVTSVLAKHQINIGCFGLARDTSGSAAVSVLNVDEAIPDAVMDELESLGMLTNLRRVNLLELNTAISGGIWETFLKPTSTTEEAAAEAAEDEAGVSIVHHPKPRVKPASPNFGSGPCKKRPGYSLASIPDIVLGRSHRSKLGKGLLEEAIVRTKKILKLPEDYHLGIVPASDTGAFEMAMWSMLGERPVDVCYWESFGKQWFKDVTTELKLDNVREFGAPFGQIPDLSQVNCDHDVLFTWNGTTSGVRVPNADWIPDDRKGLIFNDATSAAFAMEMPWNKIDVCTFSWQKVLGGEGGHGVIILSPRAVERLESFVPENRPIPKIFRMTNASTGKFMKGIFEGSTINTPSMLCVEDYLDALRWTESVGGQDGLIAISQRNLKVVEDFAAENSRWFKFLAADKAIRSNTSVCLLIDGLSKDEVKQMQTLLEREQVAYDIGSYRDAPPGLRIWCGATVETKDLEALLPWIKWAYLEVKRALFLIPDFHATLHFLHFTVVVPSMSCNGCRVLRKGCSESCILRPCLQWIETSEAQGHATVFVAKFFGRAGLMSFISAVPESQRPSLFQSLLFEACGRTVNPVNGAVGLLWTGNWHVCQAAVDTVLRGGTLRPINDFLAAGSPNLSSDETSEAEVACTDMWKLRDSYPNSRFSNSRSRLSPKRKRSEESSTKNQLNDLNLRLTPTFVSKSTPRAATPSMNSEESETTTCFESGLGDHHHYYPEEGTTQRKLLNLFV